MSPLKVGPERGAKLGVGWESHLIGAVSKQQHPADALLGDQRLIEVLADHPVVFAKIELRTVCESAVT